MADIESAEVKTGARSGLWADAATVGRNGVSVGRRAVTSGSGYRSYEIHQRMRVEQSTEKLDPLSLVSTQFGRDPYPTLAILRENYPCYRDWIGNSYWISRYDDVTSVFVDDANYETRSRRWSYGLPDYGIDLRNEPEVLAAFARSIDQHAAPVAERLAASFAREGGGDLAIDFCARYPLELLGRALDLPTADFNDFCGLYWDMQNGFGWEPVAEQRGLRAIAQLTAYFRPILAARRLAPGADIVSAIATLDVNGRLAKAEDVVATLLESDHETLHGALANLWFLLLTHPEQFHAVRSDTRMIKAAYLETLRHSTPVVTAMRFSRHEVERFGQLLPEGALVVCAAAAANRDPLQFSEPNRFDIHRKDLSQREPRGQYRADGLPAAIVTSLGPPSKYPAEPEDRPRSHYAITRDTAVTAARILAMSLKNLRLQPDAAPALRALRTGGMYTCWHLPVRCDDQL